MGSPSFPLPILLLYLCPMIVWDLIAYFLITLLLMAFFAGIEMAFYSANRLSIELKKKDDAATSSLVSRFLQFPSRFLGSTLIGFTICLVVLVLLFNVIMGIAWQYFHVGSGLLHIIVEIAVTTLLVLFFAVFFPRAYFHANSTYLLNKLAHITNFFYQLFYPLANGLINLAEWLLKYIFNIRLDKTKEALSRNDLKVFFPATIDEDRLERNTQLLENAQELPNVKIRQCLVPRKEIVGIESSATIEDLRKKFIETKLSKLVVFENDIDHIIGYAHQLGLFRKPAILQDVLLTIPAVPESMSATDLITKFSRERKSIAWVVDEFGGTAGIVTMEDVLEELFGEIKDEYDIEEFVEKQLAENEYMFSGRLELDYLNGKYGFDFGKEDSETLSGYIINFCETIPQQKERIIIEDYEFDIVHVSDTRIEMVKMKKLK